MKRDLLDCRNLLCPMPVIRTQASIARMQPGDELEVIATDPGALQDIPAWCRVHGHELLDTWEDGKEIHLLIRANAPQ
ncbi:sulfurtransferase TusA family protein [Halorhodospira halochloris]|uniref:Response regulator SirA n=1 Tax=Halorhodospira halochloris TaxID=1052 RepID=A0A2Z6EZB0_HALHR|nr:sulfurtransferase TusA family protein [Halorhodospira halochloris]MBK1650822.1 SirA family protein [Halorhodospira halochloris]MCG5530262.1 sulfurtransferase TusA family protein [Halorhodospira halochloris]MCG5547176.1 sulfurtransferase TusA family protein [Halorhodospira halochloris]BBE10936.1 response regulator SirA [Halorhodospira halochloris]